MLSELHIENVAVIRELTLPLGGGFSALTGETGAGKSIIIDSLNLLLGARSARELIRTGERQAFISACFCEMSERTLSALSALGITPDDDGTLYLQRSMQTDGRASARINGRSVPVSLLREAGAILVNIHGQHDSQALLSADNHLGFLDMYAKTEPLLEEYAAKYRELAAVKRRLSEKTKDAARLDERIDTVQYQISEIDAAKLRKNELRELSERRTQVKNAEKIMRHTRAISEALSDGGSGEGAVSLTEKAINALHALDGILPDAEALAARLESARFDMLDIAEQASALTGGESFSPEEELDRIESRLDTVNRILRKYGPDTEDVFRYRDKAVAELNELKKYDDDVADLKSELNTLAKEAFTAAEALTAARTAAAAVLSEKVTAELRFLDLASVSFSVSLTPLKNEKGVTRFSPTGCDGVEFLISTNPGEPLAPLARIASGGELSRIMLAIKSVLAGCDGTETLIFDEIDTGISGKTSQKIGIKLKKMGSSAQVICITHSAQIAALADAHYRITKSETDGRAETSVIRLEYEDRVSELSRIMGGIEITESVKKAAREMIAAAKEI